MISGVYAAQANQFQNLPVVQPTGGRVTSFLTGSFQLPTGGTDILFINAPVAGVTTSSVTAGIMLDGEGFTTLPENQITFANTTNVVAALGDYNGDQMVDFAFAYVPRGSNNIDLCVYYGTGATAARVAGGLSSFAGLNDTSGCLVIPSRQAQPPVLSNMASFPLQTGGVAQLLLEDSANSILYIIANNGKTGSNGNLQGFAEEVSLLPDGAGPIYVGDFNGDGYTDFIINGQTGRSASSYISSVSRSFFAPSHIYKFDHGVQSMLMQDMDHDGIADMVVEGTNGTIEIFKGNADGTFATTNMGGTALTPGSVAGEGGRLAAINPNTQDILTATPIGLSLLQPQSGTLTYALKTIYNIGPGRTSFALVDFHGAGSLDLAVDSAEGVAMVTGNSDGTFQASNAYSALAPGLAAVVGQFRNFAHNPTSARDVVVGTGATQAQLLKGNGDGTFSALGSPVNAAGGPGNIPASLWSNILSGDFDGDGNLDVLYSFTGLPQPGPAGDNFPILYIQYGSGDGTFGSAGYSWDIAAAPGTNGNILYPESAVGDFNGGDVADLLIGDAEMEGDLLGNKGAHGLNAGFFHAGIGGPAFNQVAAGFFKLNRTSQQDVVFQQGATFTPYMNKQDRTGKNFTQEPVLTGPGAPLYPGTLLLTDVDGDGNGDIVALYYNAAPNPVSAGPISPAQLYIWYGNGDGTFQPPQILSLSRNYYLGAVADMNAGGRPDLVLSDGSLVCILYNQGGRSFGAVQSNGELVGERHFLAGQGINSISVADVNGDGVPDLIAANGGATISNAVVLGGNSLPSIALAPNPADINTGGITVLLNSADTANSQTAHSPTHAIMSSTTTELFLCIGPTAACPSLGIINPPPQYSANLPMYYGQTWNGTTDAIANDLSAITGTITLIDIYNGVTLPPLCMLLAGVPGACPPSVGTTQGTSGGTNVLTSVYSGDSTHAGSTSRSVTITVSPDTTTATLAGSPNPSPAGQPVTFTSTLSGNYAAPTGPVNFVELFPPTKTLLLLGTATLVPGSGLTSTATFTTSALPLGTDSIQAQYAATLNFDAANSPMFVETITPSLAGNFTLSVTPTPVSVGVGYSTLLTVTVTPQNGFSLGVNLACANMPMEATCFFDTASLAGGGGTTDLVVATTSPHSCGTTQPYFLGVNNGGMGMAPIALPALAGLLAMFLPGRRRWLRALIALIAVAGAEQMTGCGNCTDLGTRPATYTFQVTGTSIGTSEVQAQSVTITVTI